MENQNQQPGNHIDYFAPKILWTIIIALLLVVVVGSVLWYQEENKTVSSNQETDCNGPMQDGPYLEVMATLEKCLQKQQAEMATWKTYTNAEYGFEFKYPPQFNDFKNRGNKIPIVLAGSNGNISLWDIDGEFSIEGIIEIENFTGFEIVKNPYQVTLNRGSFIRDKIKTDSIECAENIYFNRSEKLIHVSFSFCDDDLINQILSTFKFVESDQSIKPCGTYDETPPYEYQHEVDQKLIDGLNIQNIKNYLDEGYTARDLCSSSGKLLLFFDFTDGYWKSAGKVTEQELSEMETKGLLGLIDIQTKTSQFYKINLSPYQLEGPGGSDCDPLKFINNKILYSCVSAGDSAGITNWKAYDTQTNTDVLVKYQHTDHRPDPKNDETKVYDQSLLNLFSN